MVEEIVQELKEKSDTSFSEAQYRLWLLPVHILVKILHHRFQCFLGSL